MMLRSTNPATLEVLGETPEFSPEDIERSLQSAQRAFQTWRNVGIDERAALMVSLASQLRARKSDDAKLMSQEIGKTIKAAEAEIEKCALTCEYYGRHAATFLEPEIVKTDVRESFVRFDPLGVVLAIMPWNFPFWQVVRFAAPALVAGNVGLLKHASNAQLSARALEERFNDAKFPAGVFQNLPVSSARVAPLIADSRIAAVTLTGSERAGSEVAKLAGSHLKKTVLELGGSDPFIVFSDADVPRAAEVALSARLQGNVGQSCIAAKRFIVEKSVTEKFTDLVVRGVQKLVVGDPLDPRTDVGPLATEQVLKDTESQIERSLAQGARILAGGTRGEGGYFFQPAVLINVTESMPVCAEEMFGPVMPIIAFENEEEAVRIANNTPYGLGASIFTSDLERAKRLASRIEAGAVFVNGQVKSDPRMPFGGVKRSGYGRELSHYGLKEFVNIKSVSIQQ